MRYKNSIKTLLTNLHRHNKTEPDIYIFTLPRTGSTLLAEILNTNSHSKMASESFAMNKDNCQVLENYFDNGFLAERYIDISPNNLRQVFKYYEDLSKGKNWNSYYWSDFFTPQHNFKTTRTIFKTHKFTYHFDSLMSHFKEDFGLYLLRNPISHSLSRLNHKWSNYINLYAESKKIYETLPEKAKIKINQVNHKGSDLEKFVVSWCLENYVFIRSYQESRLSSNVFPVFYEDLIIDSENTIKDICVKIKMEFNENMLTIMNIPSSGIVHSTNETKAQIISGNKNYLANRWKESINTNTIVQVKDILISFGITLYLDDLSI